MSEQYEVRLAGAGGQGLLLAGLILAEAAAIYDGKNAAQTQSYGPEARGGASRSEVIISDEEIDYPKVTKADLLLTLSQEACDKYVRDLKGDGVLIVDTTNVHHIPSVCAHKLPITRIAEEATGRRITANIVALGVIVSLTKIVSRRAIEAAVADRVPEGTQELNLKALAAGFDAAKGLTEDREP